MAAVTICSDFGAQNEWEYLNNSLSLLLKMFGLKKQQLELGMEQQTGLKSGKEYVKPVYCHPAYLTYMQSTS